VKQAQATVLLCPLVSRAGAGACPQSARHRPCPAPGFIHVHEPEAWPDKYHGPTSEKQPGLCPRRGCGRGRRHAHGRNSDRRLSGASSPPSGRGRPGNPPRPITARPRGDRDPPFPLPPRPGLASISLRPVSANVSRLPPPNPPPPSLRHSLRRSCPLLRQETTGNLYILPLPALPCSLLLPPALFPRNGGRREQSPAGHQEQSSSQPYCSVDFVY
jgi:hypothetical protein